MRIKRGTLAADKEGGRLYVVLDIEPTTEPTHDQTAAHIASLQDQVRYLREQLDAEREARTEERRRHDTLMAQLTSRIPAIEAPQEPSESPESAADEQQGRGAVPDAGGREEATERPWWRRMFGG